MSAVVTVSHAAPIGPRAGLTFVVGGVGGGAAGAAGRSFADFSGVLSVAGGVGCGCPAAARFSAVLKGTVDVDGATGSPASDDAVDGGVTEGSVVAVGGAACV